MLEMSLCVEMAFQPKALAAILAVSLIRLQGQQASLCPKNTNLNDQCVKI